MYYASTIIPILEKLETATNLSLRGALSDQELEALRAYARRAERVRVEVGDAVRKLTEAAAGY